jgi:two-component system NarL family sensor kinase
VAEHADARHVRIELRRHGDGVALEVADDGRGMEPERVEQALAEGHIGLASVTQRVEANGGELQLQTTPESGTQVWARLLDQEPGARS